MHSRPLRGESWQKTIRTRRKPMADKAQPDEHRQQKEDIEDFGTVALTQGAHVIHCLTVIG